METLLFFMGKSFPAIFFKFVCFPRIYGRLKFFLLKKKSEKSKKITKYFFSKSVCHLSKWHYQPMISQKKHYWRVYAWKKIQKNILDFEASNDIFLKKFELWFWKFQKCTKSGLLQTKICAEISASKFSKTFLRSFLAL